MIRAATRQNGLSGEEEGRQAALSIKGFSTHPSRSEALSQESLTPYQSEVTEAFWEG
jgi:hypothetical protein